MDFGWLTGQKVSEWPTMFKHFGGFKNRADGYILRNRIQMQQKPQRRNSFTLRLNGCRADFQNRNIRVCCMDGIMDGTDILPLLCIRQFPFFTYSYLFFTRISTFDT